VIPFKLPILINIVLILAIAPMLRGQEFPSSAGPRTLRHLRLLDDDQWKVREQSQRWLVENSMLWLGKISPEWTPESPEAAWRWRRTVELVDRLAHLRRELASEFDGKILDEATNLAQESGRALDAVLEECLVDPDPLVRSRAVSILPSIPTGSRLLRHLPPDDSSPQVRRALLVACRILDIDGGRNRILHFLQTEEPGALREATLLGVRELGDPLLLPALEAAARREPEQDLSLSLTRVSIGGVTQMDALSHLLELGSYRQRHAALDALLFSGEEAPFDLLQPLLFCRAGDLRRRVLSLIERGGVDDAALALLPLLEKREMLPWVIAQMVRLEASDYYGDVAAALERIPVGERCAKFLTERGVPRLVPIDVSTEDVKPQR